MNLVLCCTWAVVLMSGMIVGSIVPFYRTSLPNGLHVHPPQQYWSSSVIHPNGLGGSFAYHATPLISNTLHQPIVTYQLVPAGIAPQWLVHPSYLGGAGLHHTVVYPAGGVIPAFGPTPSVPAPATPPVVPETETEIESVSDEADQPSSTTDETTEREKEESGDGDDETDDSVSVEAV